MKINEIITEAFDQPYKSKWAKGEFGDYDILVKLPDGSPLSITFNHEGDNEWHVAFERGHSQDITGEGDAQRIFATVLATIQKFIKKHKPQQLTFSATKDVEPDQNSESRVKLYNRLVDRYATSWGYDALINDLGDQVEYELTRLQPVTEEEFNGIDIDMDIEGDEILVTALGNGRELGHVLFVDEGEYLMPQDLEVDERFQGQGIAAAMYDYVKSKGYKIRRSGQQTDAGAGFWGKHRPEQNVWESFLGEANASAVQFQTASTDNYQSSFTVTAIADGKTVGHFSFFRDPETDDVHNQAEVTDDVRGQGYGKALLLKAIEVANDHGLGFQEDSQSLSRAQSRVYDSLYDAGWIVDADGYWFLTPEGEQELARLSTMQQGVAEDAVKDLEKDLKEPHSYDAIDHMMKTIAREEGITAKALHDRFVDKHGMTPDDWIKNKLSENFADGKVKGKSRPGRVKRSGASCNGSVTDLRQRAKNASGEKAKMYHWCANMKSGRKK